MTIFEYIRNEIINLGYTNVYVNSYNDDYDNIVSVNYIQPVKSPKSTFGLSAPITVIRNMEFEIMVRDINFKNGYNCIDTIREYFSCHRHATKQLDIIAKSDISTKGNDSKNRSIVTCQFYIKSIGGTTLWSKT